MKPARHRNLFNGDCNFLVGPAYAPPGDERYDICVMTRFIDQLANNGVDTYLANVNGQVPWYPSKLLPHVLSGYRRGDKDFVVGHFPPTGTDFTETQLDTACAENLRYLNRYLDLLEAGVDWLEAVCRHCRTRGVSPWASIRMNDAHGANSWERSYMNCALQRDPRFRLSGRRVDDPNSKPDRFRQLLDYRHAEVREYFFTMIRELVEDYDIDGLELDWLRCPFCCEPPASDHDHAAMLEWFARVRELCRQHNVFLGLRVPCRIALLREIGLDIQAMARRDLIDFIAFSNFWQSTWNVPYDELRPLVGDNVAIYGVIEAAPNWMSALAAEDQSRGFRLQSMSPELLRGNAAGKLATGEVDGIETFNFFCADEPAHFHNRVGRRACYAALRGLQDLSGLRGRPKHYVFSSGGGFYAFEEFELPTQVPLVLQRGEKRTLRLTMCREPNDASLELIIQVITRSKDGDERPPSVSINRSQPISDAMPTNRLLFPCGAYTHHIPEHRAWNYAAHVADVREGWNEIVVYNDRPTPVDIVGVELSVSPTSAGSETA